MVINSDYTCTYNEALGAVEKLTAQYLTTGGLRTLYEELRGDDIRHGVAYEYNLILAGGEGNIGTPHQDEHKKFPVDAVSAIFTADVGGLYCVTVDDDAIDEITLDVRGAQDYAGAITETVYQQWYDTINTAVETGFTSLATSPEYSIPVTLGDDIATWARMFIATIQGTVKSLRQGITGATYGNSVVGNKKVAANGAVVIVLNNVTLGVLNAFGFASAFQAEKLTLGEDLIIYSNASFPKNTALITDKRNIQLHKHHERVTTIPNLDGSRNIAFKRYDYFEVAKTSDGKVLFPYCVITTTEGAAASSASFSPKQSYEMLNNIEGAKVLSADKIKKLTGIKTNNTTAAADEDDANDLAEGEEVIADTTKEGDEE